MSHVKKVVETLGGWRPALRMVRPSTSTFVMMSVLVVLVIFFPENQWGWDDEKPSIPPREETQVTSTEPTSEHPDTVSSSPSEENTTPLEPTEEAPKEQRPNDTERGVENTPPPPPHVGDTDHSRNQKPSATVTVTQAPPPRGEIRNEITPGPSSSETPEGSMNNIPEGGGGLESES